MPREVFRTNPLLPFRLNRIAVVSPNLLPRVRVVIQVPQKRRGFIIPFHLVTLGNCRVVVVCAIDWRAEITHHRWAHFCFDAHRLGFFISVREVDDQVRDADQYRGDAAPLDTLGDLFLLRMREYGSEEDEYAEAKRNPNKTR
jgi:hypothetical protein